MCLRRKRAHMFRREINTRGQCLMYVLAPNASTVRYQKSLAAGGFVPVESDE